MRPLRFIILLTLFVALPVFLTCWSLLSSHDAPTDTLRAGYNAQTSQLRALFSFSTPTSLFPPSAIISLTNDNSTFFVARPAAFGPSLPSRGLSGQLWVGRGFGDETVFEEGIHVTGWELGCSDVPGWREDERKRLEKVAIAEKPRKRSVELEAPGEDTAAQQPSDDGTDDYLHHPLSDSNPARHAKPGEQAEAELDKTKVPTHADIESLQEGAAIAGKVVLLARGGCGFLEKVKWVQRRGGIAVIVGDRERGASLAIMYAKGDTSNVTIPAIFTSYNAAHLLSSLVPVRGQTDALFLDADAAKSKILVDKPVFTSLASGSPKPTPSSQSETEKDDNSGWMHEALEAIGLGDGAWHGEDSRRPPGSGNIEWVLMEDWNEEEAVRTSTRSQFSSMTKSILPTTSSIKGFAPSRRPGGDDFVIGVQDWRDTGLIAPKPSASSSSNVVGNQADQSSSSLNVQQPLETALKGGSITPGSGEYDNSKLEHNSQEVKNEPLRPQQHSKAGPHVVTEQEDGLFGLFRSSKSSPKTEHRSQQKKPQALPAHKKPKDGKEQPEALWVTLTPTSVSTSPFFDTLLVLVVSPLVTLTVVYALLLLRSRIRRRRWRAPKSVVERLPVRTYHTTSTSSSTTSSHVPTPAQSAVPSPILRPSGQSIMRPRSQTTNSVLGEVQASSPPPSVRSLSKSPSSEKHKPRVTQRKRYNGRQIECVVCLEEYVDGESRVMSLPCGHEFHADCITPWLVNRRRTCPICKGDVVRSLNKAGQGQRADQRQAGDETSDDVQERVAQTANEESSAAIPIPPRDDDEIEDEDIERGQDSEEPLLGEPVEGQTAWRNVVARSLSRLSGDTIFRQTPVDRNR